MTKVTSALLIGGSGFLGLHMIEQFYRHCPGAKISVFDIRPLPEKISKYFTFNPEDIDIFIGDITSEADVSKAVRESGANVVVHSASPLANINNDALYELVNVKGTANVISVCEKLKIKALVYTSSAGVIFNGEDVINGDETWPFAAVHMDKYNETKATAETLVVNANNPNGLRTVCIRPSGIFGPGDRQLVPGLRAAARLGQSKFQMGDNNNICDWTYAGNVADGHILAAEKLLAKEDTISGEVFIVTNDAPTYFWTLARTVWKADGIIEPRIFVFPRPLGMVLARLSEIFAGLTGKEPGLTPFRVKMATAFRYHDISKAKTLLGYKPAVGLEDGIKYTIDWMNEMA